MDFNQSSQRLIVALDFHAMEPAWKLIEQLNSRDVILKIGSEMFTLFGPDFVRALVKKNFKVFLDLKFHDIPHTVAKACASAADLGVWMINVHASGGIPMMEAAVTALAPFGQDKPLLIAVTVLTSLTETQLHDIGISCSSQQQALRLSKTVFHAGLDGVVCSALEVPSIKSMCGQNFLTVTPGIRLAGDHPKDDQARVATVQQAIDLGSDYLVVGRPITQANNPDRVVANILECLSKKY